MSFEQDLIDQMKSWESGYLSPSAQMLFKQAREFIEEKLAYITELEAQIEELKKNQKKTTSKKNV